MVVRLIIDTDPGVDDILGILMALGLPDQVIIEAITLNFGNTTLDHCYNNILRTFQLLHKHIGENPEEASRKKLAAVLRDDAPKIILSSGAANPLGGKQFTAKYFHGRDGLSGVSNDEIFPVPRTMPSPLKATERPAHKVILDILRTNPPGSVRIAAVGPLTNIALAFQDDPESFLRVAGISVMGCTLDSPGNTTPVAEFNTYADPFAARFLLQDAPLHPLVQKIGGRLPMDILPLDVTTSHEIPFSRLCNDSEEDAGILCRFRRAILTRPRSVMNSFADPSKTFDAKLDDNFSAHDPLAIAHAIHCPSPYERRTKGLTENGLHGWIIKTRRFGIETEGTLTRGMCVVDRRKLGKGKVGVNRTQEMQSQLNGSSNLSSPSSNDTITSVGKAASTGVAAAPAEKHHHQPSDGEWDVVMASPGIAWFTNLFCSALGV